MHSPVDCIWHSEFSGPQFPPVRPPQKMKHPLDSLRPCKVAPLPKPAPDRMLPFLKQSIVYETKEAKACYKRINIYNEVLLPCIYYLPRGRG